MDKITFDLLIKLIKEYKESAYSSGIRLQKKGDRIADDYFGESRAYGKVLSLLKEISGDK